MNEKKGLLQNDRLWMTITVIGFVIFLTLSSS
jgi:hypothetical protein